jgi:hypothetical protein
VGCFGWLADACVYHQPIKYHLLRTVTYMEKEEEVKVETNMQTIKEVPSLLKTAILVD